MVTNDSNRIDYVADGTVGPYDVPFLVFDPADLVVIERDPDGNETLLTEPADYTFTPTEVEYPTVGTILFEDGQQPEADFGLSLIRRLAETQPTALVEAGPFPAKSVEHALDRLAMLVQQLGDRMDRAVLLPATSPVEGLAIPDPDVLTNRGRVLRIAPDGLTIDSILLTSGDIPNEVAIQTAINVFTKANTFEDNVTFEALVDLSTITAPLDQLVPGSLYADKGDLLAGSAVAGEPVIVTVGANGKFLKANSAQAGGVEWADPTVDTSTVPLQGQCRLVRDDATHITLLPYNGNHMVVRISGVWTVQVLDFAGVTLSTAGLAVDTTYNVYYFNDGTQKLECSTTAHEQDTDTGYECKFGDHSKLLVGKVHTDGATEFVDTLTKRLVINWFNRRPVTARAENTANRTGGGANATFASIHSELNPQFLAWGDEAVHFHCQTYGFSGGNYAALAIDSISTMIGFGSVSLQHIGGSAIPTEGFHTSILMAYANTTAVFSTVGAFSWGLRNHVYLKG